MSLPTHGFGARSADVRHFRGWSQADLAARLGYEKTWVSKLERGKRDTDNLPVGDLFRLAAVLGVSPWTLLTGWNPSKPIDLGLGEVTAGRVWAWASWEDSLVDYASSEDEALGHIGAYHLYSPRNLPGLSEESWDEVDAALDRVKEVFAKPVEVAEGEATQIVHHSGAAVEEVIAEFRSAIERIAALTAEKKETK